jgi:hypothetical protein
MSKSTPSPSARVTLFGTRPPVWRRIQVADENRTKLAELIETLGAKLLYEYDFGDGWQHQLLLEEVLLGDESSADLRGG